MTKVRDNNHKPTPNVKRSQKLHQAQYSYISQADSEKKIGVSLPLDCKTDQTLWLNYTQDLGLLGSLPSGDTGKKYVLQCKDGLGLHAQRRFYFFSWA